MSADRVVTVPTVRGAPVTCRCGCMAFMRPKPDASPEVYACVSCGSWYETIPKEDAA